MFEWSEEHQMIRQAMKDFIAKEIVPIRDALIPIIELCRSAPAW
jgi:hypothetical protein